MLKLAHLIDDSLIALLLKGGVGVIPTDTVYGLVGAASLPETVTRLYRLKHREQKPGTIIAGSITQLIQLGVKARYLKAVENYWPGAISVVIPVGEELRYLHQGVHSLAFRIPHSPMLIQFLERTGPLITSSANHPGEAVATTLDQAEAYFGDQVDFYVDGGDLRGQLHSTVIRIVDDAIEVLRMGAVKINENGVIS
ncbi:MAG: L-threonylcarbamoyladenylate synthase [Candidatus Saccharimonadales bacterium]